MNPEAAEWLEGLDDQERRRRFTPVYPWDGNFFSLKKDHEPCIYCRAAIRYGTLEVIE